MNKDKSPGCDGFNPGFFQKFWPIVGSVVTEACLSWWHNEQFSVELNQTNLVLIPKKNKPTNMKELRPIALCQVIYKVFSKILPSRLKRILPKIVFDFQSAFVEGHVITDNIVVTNEIIHFMKGYRS